MGYCPSQATPSVLSQVGALSCGDSVNDDTSYGLFGRSRTGRPIQVTVGSTTMSVASNSRRCLPSVPDLAIFRRSITETPRVGRNRILLVNDASYPSQATPSVLSQAGPELWSELGTEFVNDGW